MTDQKYNIQLAEAGDQEEIDKYVNENFYPDMPMFAAFGMDDLSEEEDEKTTDPENVAFVVKAVSSEGDIVGVAINRTKPPPHLFTDTMDPKLVQLFEFMEFIRSDSKISELPGRVLELYILSVASEWRHKGMAKRLTKESLRLAKEQGYDTMKVCCGNKYTAMTVSSLGFEQFYSLAYSDYSKASGRDVTIHNIPPHDTVTYYIKHLV